MKVRKTWCISKETVKQIQEAHRKALLRALKSERKYMSESEFVEEIIKKGLSIFI